MAAPFPCSLSMAVGPSTHIHKYNLQIKSIYVHTLIHTLLLTRTTRVEDDEDDEDGQR